MEIPFQSLGHSDTVKGQIKDNSSPRRFSVAFRGVASIWEVGTKNFYSSDFEICDMLRMAKELGGLRDMLPREYVFKMVQFAGACPGGGPKGPGPPLEIEKQKKNSLEQILS